jgi:hypothetical protein
MAKIIIDASKSISNYHALEGVAKWMLKNYHSREYRDVRAIKVSSGKVLSIEQVEPEDQSSICNCHFIVKLPKEDE